ncbi:hypothetical protein TRFO_34492 [Tritrichomonas foetus]|uniref:Tetraspanin family protein n=1 Tax=Tritrichomonas foetus TaxID=1144522 RepID=A0A1J4JJ11_9EUKA|nr:hypothetical protein TRFO_34492 [Tritrichomonas foetus]|eukprot:OHS99138.1 hypothetical protein TRFO_34492 [Tritrichomonas foetus]
MGSLKIIGISVCAYVQLSSAIILIVMSGISYNYFSNEILIFSPKLQHHIFFGCGIGVGFVVFIGLWIFLFFPKTIYNYIVTFPLLLILPCVYLYFSQPGSSSQFIKDWDQQWSVDLIETEMLQKKNKCCGWKNYTDKSLYPCPINFVSGCQQVVTDYLDPRFHEIFIFSCVSLIMGTVSTVMLVATMYFSSWNSFFSFIDVV